MGISTTFLCITARRMRRLREREKRNEETKPTKYRINQIKTKREEKSKIMKNETKSKTIENVVSI